ncbi:MAG: AMP-binding protein [Bacteroidetes bacterium]|nr:AMP-binding protein [Bacteroidota bacterium]
MPELVLPDLLLKAALEYPDLGINYMRDDGSLSKQSYWKLKKEAESLSSGFVEMGIKPGDTAIIITDNNQETINCLWGCFFAGIVPTILQSPVSTSDHSQAAVKLLNVFQQLGKPLVICSKPIGNDDEEFGKKMVLYSSLRRGKAIPGFRPLPDDLAFIQFSSGSTGDPKGIMLSHRNLAVNMNSIALGLHLTHDDHTGNWMPLYHDMGLIGYHLTPIYFTHEQYHIETVDFIKNPSLWLDLISEQSINVTGCPNFGQALVLRHLKRKVDFPAWNFSRMKAMLNGAEPISVRIMDEFVSQLQRFQFPVEAMMPVYGMAEATLAISFTPLMQPSVITQFDIEELDRNRKAIQVNPSSTGKTGRQISGVGVALDRVNIRLVDEHEQEVPEGISGHIQISGPSVTHGYYQNSSATEALFCGDWLRTGDIGFFFKGNLYISGRHKDIIFMNGKNYFAHDLESLACTLEDLSYGKVIFGGITDPKSSKEKVLAFVAGISEPKAPELLHRLRLLFRKNLGIQLDELILLRSNEIPKTSSGKIQRYKIIQRYLAGEFKEKRVK